MLTFKSNCRFLLLKPQTVVAMFVAHELMKSLGHECVITSVDDSTHMKNSLHYSGQAFDIRAHDLPETESQKIVSFLKEALTPEYDIIFERFPENLANNHIHVEYDPKLDLPKPKPLT